ncbi:MAG: orotidine-5'-phosphate decarboxylase [Spirochaetota bacterium]
MSSFFARLETRARAIESVLCVGLDPRIPIGSDPEQIVDANRRIIEATSDLTLCYKPNIAFYEQHGAAGIDALEETLAGIPDGIPVILDAKRGDIGSTAEAYAAAAVRLGVDAITLNPYLGHEAITPFLEAGLAAFVLCRNSNPGSELLQTATLYPGHTAASVKSPGHTAASAESPGEPLYLTVADAALGWGECGLVVAANDTEALAAVRSRHRYAWFLAPGIGAQGGSMEEALAAGARQGVSRRGCSTRRGRGSTQGWDPGREAGSRERWRTGGENRSREG